MFVCHGNQAIRPGSYIQTLINNGEGAGYHRAPLAHRVLGQPLNLHVTPTLALAIEWATADPAAGKPWADGPALNRQIRDMIETNQVYLLGSTFSDHALPYFTKPFNRDNESLSRSLLEQIYDCTIDRNRAVFWPPERLLDVDVFEKIRDMGYHYALLDQDTHLFNWYGRQEALTDAAYKLNEIRNAGNTDYIVCTFVINNVASSYRFDTDDGGLDIALRGLLNRKAYGWLDEHSEDPVRIVTDNQDQVITIMSNWEDFRLDDNADAYDINLRWLANRPWTPVVALEQIVAGEIDVTGDGVGDPAGVGSGGWAPVHRTEYAAMQDKEAHNWLNHASQEDYDHWYVGQPGVEEGLEHRVFDVRPGAPLPQPYGMLYTTGIVKAAWQAVQGVADSSLSWLARATLHASVFQTAFHNEDNHNLQRYSTGDYMYPATSSNSLATFAAVAQAQSRAAAVYARVDAWAADAGGLAGTATAAEDVDLDGESEYLLYNGRLFLLMESIGGRMTGAWFRDPQDGAIFQIVGNFGSYAGSETEVEGATNVEAEGDGARVVAHRTSALKDWRNGSRNYVNDLYNFAAVSNGWSVSSPDVRIVKRVTLAPDSNAIEVEYTTDSTVYVRNGLSPHLADLLQRGQAGLGALADSGAAASLANAAYSRTLVMTIGYADAGHNTGLNLAATDEDTNLVDFATVTMRNQAQTHQIELYGGPGTFAFSIGLSTEASDWDGDGMPNPYEDGYPFLDPNDGSDGTNDFDGDGLRNADEYVAGTGPDDSQDSLHASDMTVNPGGVTIRFPAKAGRSYTVWYDSSLMAPAWSNATPTPLSATTNGPHEWTDDGTTTSPHPFSETDRFYQIRATWP